MSAQAAASRSPLHVMFAPNARRRTLLAGATVIAALLAACGPSDGNRWATGIYRVANSQRNPSMEVMEQTVEYSVVQASRAVVHAPQALLVLERNLGPAYEQRIILPNGTAVRGDNVLHVRAQSDESMRLGEFNFDEVVTRFGGLPAPFEQLNANTVLSGEDSLGSYIYARETLGTSTVCVLALRRMTVGARPLPRGAQAMDVMLRNCVVGTAEQALAPLDARTLATGGTGQRTLSPYAAPQG